ncbi:unnamed protein product, partial [Strongylus vulgaris]
AYLWITKWQEQASKFFENGDDNVIECSALTGQSLSMKFSYNTKKNNVRIKGEEVRLRRKAFQRRNFCQIDFETWDETIRAQYFLNETATITDKVLYCSAIVDVGGWPSSYGQVFTYNKTQSYYLLLAAGSALTSSLTQHKTTDVSTILMLLAWFFFVPTAGMFARFLRSSWPTLRPGGLLVWFHVHRACNSIAIILMTASFICILTANSWNWTGPGSHSGRWSEMHTLIGIFTLCLAWIQPFVSAMRTRKLNGSTFRCNPSHPRRPYFNWAHRGIGVTAMTLAS